MAEAAAETERRAEKTVTAERKASEAPAGESIYGPCAEVLPLVLKELEGRISSWNREAEQKTGHKLYEHLTTRVKSEESMREKCRRRGLPETPESALTELHDAVGLRIVTRFLDDIYRIRDLICAMEGCTVLEEKDYIRNVKPNGYRSYHMIISCELPYRDLQGNLPGHFAVEIQIRTIAMDSWASLEHEMSYKKTINNRALITAELKRCADELASCDVSMQTICDLIRAGEEKNHESTSCGG